MYGWRIGRAGSFFDSAWLRLSHVNYTHRMNRYEKEVASRLEHHLLRDGPGDGRSSLPVSDSDDDEAMDAPQPSSANVAGVPTSLDSFSMDDEGVAVR